MAKGNQKIQKSTVPKKPDSVSERKRESLGHILRNEQRSWRLRKGINSTKEEELLHKQF